MKIQLPYVVLVILILVVGGLIFRPSKKAGTYSFASVYDGTLNDPAATLENLKKCQRECSPDEAVFAQRMVNFLEPVVKRQKQMIDELPAITEVVEDVLSFYEQKKDIEALLTSYTSALTFEKTLKNFGAPDTLFNKHIDDGITRLPLSFPASSKAFGLYASLLVLRETKTEDIVRAFRQCTILDEKNRNCMKDYYVYADDYVLPRCGASHLPENFGLYVAATMNRADSSKKVFAGSDLSGIYPTKDGADFSVRFTKEMKRKLDDVTRENVGKYIVAVLGGQIWATSLIRQENITGHVEFKFTDKKRNAFKSVCGDVITPVLPNDLKYDFTGGR